MKSSLSLSSLNKKLDSYKDGTIAMFQSLKQSSTSNKTFDDFCSKSDTRYDFLMHRIDTQKWFLIALIVTNVLSLIFNFI